MAFNYQAYSTLGVNLNRQKYAPLDISEVFNSQADLNYYISKGTITEGVSEYWYKDAVNRIVPYPYPSQIVGLVIDRDVSLFYLVEKEDGTFDAVPLRGGGGEALTGDGVTVQIVDGVISLVGIDDTLEAEKKYQPVLVNGKLAWQEVSETTVEGLDTSIKVVEGEVKDLQDQTTAIEEKIGAVEEGTTIVEMIESTKTEVITTILGETVNADFDTLQEVAEWILADTTNSAELILRVTAIEEDYLKGADKEELQDKIDDLTAFVGALPEGSASTTVVEYIQEVVTAINLGDYAKAEELTALSDRLDELSEVISGVSASIGGLIDRVLAVESDKVDKVEGSRLMTEEEGEKLNALPVVSGFSGEFQIDEETKQVSIFEIAHTKITGLAEILGQKISEIHVDGTALPVVDGKVEMPIAGVNLGLVRSHEAENGIVVAADGTMEVHSLNLRKLVQSEGDWLVLDGGDAGDRTAE